MQPVGLVILSAGAMVASAFFPWFSGEAAAGTSTPFAFTDTLLRFRGPVSVPDYLMQYYGTLPGYISHPMLLMLAGLVLAALLVILSLFGAAPRLFAMAAGLLPFASVGYAAFGAPQGSAGRYGNVAQDVAGGLQGGFSVSQLWNGVSQIAGPGLYLCFGGAALLFIFSLILPRKQQRR